MTRLSTCHRAISDDTILHIQVTVSGGLGAAALVDVLVALTLSWYLSRGRSDFQQYVSLMYKWSA